jgi:hypothetical protein
MSDDSAWLVIGLGVLLFARQGAARASASGGGDGGGGIWVDPFIEQLAFKQAPAWAPSTPGQPFAPATQQSAPGQTGFAYDTIGAPERNVIPVSAAAPFSFGQSAPQVAPPTSGPRATGGLLAAIDQGMQAPGGRQTLNAPPAAAYVDPQLLRAANQAVSSPVPSSIFANPNAFILPTPPESRVQHYGGR